MSFTRLKTSRTTIFMEIKDMKEIKWLSRMKSPIDSEDKCKYCDFYREMGLPRRIAKSCNLRLRF